jgi:hypothetical protein
MILAHGRGAAKPQCRNAVNSNVSMAVGACVLRGFILIKANDDCIARLADRRGKRRSCATAAHSARTHDALT